jgi:limonene-1,2-epoxide hydrolase
VATATPRFQSPTRIESPEQWVEIFSELWKSGSYERFARYAWVVHPDCRFVQPGFPTAHGPEGFLELFRVVFALMPDATAQIHRGGGDGDGAYIEFTLTGTLGGRPLSVDMCDVFRFQDGLMIERVSYFDPAPFRRAVLTRPRAWRHLPKLR